MKKLLLVLALLPTAAWGQLLSYESFTGLTPGNGLAGSGTNAFGWNIAGWTDGSDARFQIVDPTPDLTSQPAGGQIIDGGNRALLLTTSPEPVTGTLLASRSFIPQNTTIYASFLFRPVAVGTGSDGLDLRFFGGATMLSRILFAPDQAQRWLTVDLSKDGYGGNYTLISARLMVGQTYLFVVRLTRQGATQFITEMWIDPPASFASAGSPYNRVKSMTDPPALTAVGFGIASTDTGGPTTTAMFDEFRIGYTWADVVPPAPAPGLVPTVAITPAAKLRWLSESGKTYRVQYSYDLTNWFNLGSTISGNNQFKEVFDSTDDAKRFYRVQVE